MKNGIEPATALITSARTDLIPVLELSKGFLYIFQFHKLACTHFHLIGDQPCSKILA